MIAIPEEVSARRISRRNLLGLTAAVSVTVPGLASCAKGAGRTGASFGQVDVKPPTQYAKRQNIVLWTSWNSTNGKALDALLKAFNDSQSDIYAQAQFQGNYFDASSKLSAAIQAKKVPDIVGFGDTLWESFFVNDYIEDLDGYADKAFKDSFVPKLAEVGYIKDKFYWVPFARSTPIFYYNKDLFAKAGLPDRGPETWSELREWGAQITKVKVNGKPAKVTSFTGTDDWEFQASVWAFGGSYSDGLDVKIDTGGAVECAEWMRKLIFDDKMAYLEAEYGTNFNNGLVAAYMNSTGALRGTYEAAKFDVGCSPLPKQVDYGVPPGGAGLSILKPVPKERKDAAFEVIKFLSTPESSAKWALSTGYLPVVKDAINQADYAAKLKSDPNVRVAVDQLTKVRQDDAIRAWIPKASPTIYQGLQKIYGDNQPAQKVLSSIADDLREAAKKIEPTYNKYYSN